MLRGRAVLIVESGQEKMMEEVEAVLGSLRPRPQPVTRYGSTFTVLNPELNHVPCR